MEEIVLDEEDNERKRIQAARRAAATAVAVDFIRERILKERRIGTLTISKCFASP